MGTYEMGTGSPPGSLSQGGRFDKPRKNACQGAVNAEPAVATKNKISTALSVAPAGRFGPDRRFLGPAAILGRRHRSAGRPSLRSSTIRRRVGVVTVPGWRG